MSGRLNGKVALVTGAASGIGLGTVELFVAEGARVVAADIQDDKGGQLAARFGDAVHYVHCDVLVEADIAAAAEAAERTFGGLDVVFNNAGGGGALGGLAEVSAEAWDQTFALLVRSVFLGMKHAVPLLRRRGGGAIVNTASVAGLQAGYGPFAYSAAKSAVIHMTRCAAAELCGDGIRVNAICPGLIATSIFGAAFGLPRAVADQMAAQIAEAAPMVQPVRKAGLPRDIAEAALFLASDAAAFVTGQHFVIDGGITIGPRNAWDPQSPSPLLAALGMTPEQAQAMGFGRAG